MTTAFYSEELGKYVTVDELFANDKIKMQEIDELYRKLGELEFKHCPPISFYKYDHVSEYMSQKKELIQQIKTIKGTS